MSHAEVVHDPNATCSVHTEHRPHPLRIVRHHVLPVEAGGQDGEKVELCDTDHYAVHLLMFYAATHDGQLPPRKGTPAQRSIALAGYEAAKLAGTVALIPNEGII